jgi:hypothetical protein
LAQKVLEELKKAVSNPIEINSKNKFEPIII